MGINDNPPDALYGHFFLFSQIYYITVEPRREIIVTLFQFRHPVITNKTNVAYIPRVTSYAAQSVVDSEGGAANAPPPV